MLRRMQIIQHHWYLL